MLNIWLNHAVHEFSIFFWRNWRNWRTLLIVFFMTFFLYDFSFPQGPEARGAAVGQSSAAGASIEKKKAKEAARATSCQTSMQICVTSTTPEMSFSLCSLFVQSSASSRLESCPQTGMAAANSSRFLHASTERRRHRLSTSSFPTTCEKVENSLPVKKGYRPRFERRGSR